MTYFHSALTNGFIKLSLFYLSPHHLNPASPTTPYHHPMASHHQRNLSAKSAEALLMDMLNIDRTPRASRLPVPTIPTSNVLPHHQPHRVFHLSTSPTPNSSPTSLTHAVPPPTPPHSPNPPSAQPLPYDSYFTSISTFTSPPLPPGAGTQTNDSIHAFMATVCRTLNTVLHHSVLKLPPSDIPPGRWTCAFAPGILSTRGWAVLFGVPGASEFVWVLWPGRADGEGSGCGEDDMVRFFAGLVGEGKLRAERDMKVGDARHEMLYAVVQQAVWADGESVFLGADWRSGEFGGVF